MNLKSKIFTLSFFASLLISFSAQASWVTEHWGQGPISAITPGKIENRTYFDDPVPEGCKFILDNSTPNDVAYKLNGKWYSQKSLQQVVWAGPCATTTIQFTTFDNGQWEANTPTTAHNYTLKPDVTYFWRTTVGVMYDLYQ